MDETDLAADFETHRPHLRAVTLRLLGSPAEADDAVQETWLRLSRADVSDVENLTGWLTTVVSQPRTFATSSTSARLSRSHVSCTASSASLGEPSMR